MFGFSPRQATRRTFVILLSLIQNVALLVTLSVLLQLVMRRWPARSRWRPAISGFLYGSIAVIGMMTPVTLAPGVIFDGRSIILTAAGFFGGPLAAFIAAAMAAAYRLYLGGAGAWVGVAVAVEAAAVGLIFRTLRTRSRPVTGFAYLWLQGVIAHVIMLALLYTLPGGLGVQVLRQIAIPIIFVYPIAFVLVARLLLDQEERICDEIRLRELNESLETQVAERTQALQAINSRLASESDAKTRFLRSMSHELRTPLNSIIGFSDILDKELAGELNEEQHKQVAMIGSSGKHLLSLINDILDLSRIEAGVIKVEHDEVDLCIIAREIANTVAPDAQAKGLRVEVKCGPDSCMVVSDARKLSQVLLNFSSNAVKFTNEGSITVSVDRAPEYASISVSDTGRGIPAEEIENIFADFAQGNRRPDQHDEGTGLGLAISRGLADMLGGRIDVVSEVGSGSTFTLVVPTNS